VKIEVQSWGSGFDQLAEHMRAMLHEMQGRNYFRSHAPHSWRPRLNLYEFHDRFLVCVELAGMAREQIDVRADEAEGVLHIQGLRRKPVLPGQMDADPAVSVHLMEIDSGRFHRRVPLPGDVVIDKISAAYRHGYLWVILPRATPTPEANER